MITGINNQAEFIKKYNNLHREKFNDVLFDRSDDELIEELKKVILSCERSKYFTIKVTKFTVIDDYATMINMLKEQEDVKHQSKDNEYNQYDYINLRDSDVRLLVVDYFIKVPFPKKDSVGEKNLRVLIMVPRFVDKYYFKIMGNYYCPKFQILDGSTYNNSGSSSKCQNVTFKSLFMATRIFRYIVNVRYESGEERALVFYNSAIFSKKVPVMKYILAKYGVYGTMVAFGIPELYITDTNPKREDWYTLCKGTIYISAPRFLLDRDPILQSLVYTIYSSINHKDGYNAKDIWSTDFWRASLGDSYNSKASSSAKGVKKPSDVDTSDSPYARAIEKGESVLESLESIYDIPTKEALRLPEQYKRDIYCVLIWILREFAVLSQTDNLNISTKRRRLAAYCAALYGMKLSSGMFQFSGEKNIQVSQIEKRIHTFPDYLIKAISRDRTINNRSSVNDLDSFGAIKWTFKGIQGLGEAKDSTVPDIYRQAHPSHLGRIDLDSSSNGDPGMSGMLCPMAKTFDNYFSDFSEPNMWREEMRCLLREYKQAKGKQEIIKMRQVIGMTPILGNEGIIDEDIKIAENMIIPFVMDVDKEMIDIGKVEG